MARGHLNPSAGHQDLREAEALPRRSKVFNSTHRPPSVGWAKGLVQDSGKWIHRCV